MFSKDDLNFQWCNFAQFSEHDFYFWYFSIVPMFNRVWRGDKNSLDNVVYLKNGISKNELIPDCLITDGFVPWIVWSCKFWFSELHYFSEVDEI